MFTGPHPETGEPLEVIDEAPGGRAAERPATAPVGPRARYAPEEIAQIAEKLRQAAGLPKEPTGVVANDPGGAVGRVEDRLNP
jgi:hypothetical protein